MKRVIDGKIYNTATAEEICDLPCHAYPGDFQYHETTLYRTEKGAYFVAGKGGPMTRWAQPEGNSGYSGGSGLEVVSQEEARGYAEAAELDPDAMQAAGFELEEA
jgi:hypothetical protein